MQPIGFSCLQPLDDMRLLLRHPFLYDFSRFICNLKPCSRKFLSGRHIPFGNFHSGDNILHHHLLYLSGILHHKRDRLRRYIARSRQKLCQKISFPRRQSFDDMRLLLRHPFLNDFACFIFDLKPCSRKLLSCCDIPLGDFHLRDVILHHRLLHLPGILHRKRDRLRRRIAWSRQKLCQKIGFPHYQPLNDMRLLLRHPFLNDFASFVCDLKPCSRQFLSGRHVLFGDFHPRYSVFHNDHSGILLRCKRNGSGCRIPRGGQSFCQNIFLSHQETCN